MPLKARDVLILPVSVYQRVLYPPIPRFHRESLYTTDLVNLTRSILTHLLVTGAHYSSSEMKLFIFVFSQKSLDSFSSMRIHTLSSAPTPHKKIPFGI